MFERSSDSYHWHSENVILGRSPVSAGKTGLQVSRIATHSRALGCVFEKTGVVRNAPMRTESPFVGLVAYTKEILSGASAACREKREGESC
jgi:hypothetical protein